MQSHLGACYVASIHKLEFRFRLSVKYLLHLILSQELSFLLLRQFTDSVALT